MAETTKVPTNPTKRPGPQKSAERIQSRATSLEISETKAFSFSGWNAVPVFALLAWCVYVFTWDGLALLFGARGGEGGWGTFFSAPACAGRGVLCSWCSRAVSR